MNRKKIKGGPGQRRAAEHDGRFVTIGPMVLFSTETGMHGCWTPPINAVRDSIARDGDPKPIDFEETWQLRHRTLEPLSAASEILIEARLQDSASA